MVTKIGINGFGRIGRQVLKGMLDFHQDELEVVAINDLTDPETNAHLFKFDTNYGRYPGTVEVIDGDLVIDGHRLAVLSERDPGQIPWGDHGVQIVVESTGIFTDADKARGHLNHGPSKVVISAPAKNEDLTMVLGVNDAAYDPRRTTSCPTHPAPPTASPRSPKCSTTQSASSPALCPPSTPTPTTRRSSTPSTATCDAPAPPR